MIACGADVRCRWFFCWCFCWSLCRVVCSSCCIFSFFSCSWCFSRWCFCRWCFSRWCFCCWCFCRWCSCCWCSCSVSCRICCSVSCRISGGCWCLGGGVFTAVSRALFSRETLHQGCRLDGGHTGDKKHNGDLHLSFSCFEL